MNANELADELRLLPEKIEEWGAYASDYFKKKWDLEGDIKSAVKVVFDVETMLRQQQAELDSLRSVVYWLKENRPEVWDDIQKWSKI